MGEAVGNGVYRIKRMHIAIMMCVTAELLSMPVVTQADDLLGGKTYGELAARWWQWAFGSNFAQFKEGKVDCSAGQSGPVWFLAGTFASEPSERSCRDPIPAGKTLFFPLVNYGFWNPDGSCPAESKNACTVDQKRANANGFFSDQIPGNLGGNTQSYVCQLSATVDKVPVQNKGFGIVRTQSPVFPLKGMFIDGTTEVNDPKTIDDGYYVAIPQLARGEHVIHYTGGLCHFADSPDMLRSGAVTPIFKAEVTYKVRIR